ncbi:MAG: alpha-xylosidase, partial [Vallitaleaceae bacterium]|nr:alpha-xylosidase [Vallitaleaceae bacterium]
MKFSNGNWLMQEGVTAYSPAKVYESRISKDAVTLYVPHNHIRHRGDTLTGPVFTIELSSPMEDVIKVKMYHFKGVRQDGPQFQLNNENPAVQIHESEEVITFRSGDLTATVNKSQDWGMSFSNGEGFLTKTGFRNLGYLKVEGEGAFVKEQLHLSVDELIYGLGERFTPFIKNGQVVEIWNEDGGTSSEQSYKNIPFYLSSRGYGVLVNHPEKVSFEVGSEKVTKVQFSVPGESLEYYIINGTDYKEVLSKYTQLSGKPGLPPAWSFGLWLTTSFTTNYDEETVSSFIDGMRERDIPLHTFHFDCFWMKGFNWCDF